jgi:hypothetical protein
MAFILSILLSNFDPLVLPLPHSSCDPCPTLYAALEKTATASCIPASWGLRISMVEAASGSVMEMVTFLLLYFVTALVMKCLGALDRGLEFPHRT